MRTLVNVYCMVYAITFLTVRWVWHMMDKLGERLVYLIDHSDFFAGCIFGILIGEILTFLGR